jgi:multidrug efflux system outer membrane protein
VSLVRSLGGGWGPLPESVAANGTAQPAAQQTAQ